MVDKTYIGITYWEDGLDGLCQVIKSTDLLLMYKIISDIACFGICEYTVGYVDTNIDNIIKCSLESNLTPSEQFNRISKLITKIENVTICELYKINSDKPEWKKYE